MTEHTGGESGHGQGDRFDENDLEDGRRMSGSIGNGPPDGGDDAVSGGQSDLPLPGGAEAASTRANGLTAAYYVPLRDVDPRVGVELLGRLGQAGIAAYVAPTPGSKGGYGDVRPPSLPTDRLWVDGDRRSQAESVIAGSISEDEAFEALVAMFHESPPAEAPWPSTEELTSPVRANPWTTRRSIIARQEQEGAARTPDGEPALPAHVEAFLDEHFVPEPPPPLPRLAGMTLLAVGLIVLGVLMLVFHDQIPSDFTAGSMFLAPCAIVAGFVTLVWRMRDRDDDDSDDDGAVV
jgi:hypothetical protein